MCQMLVEKFWVRHQSVTASVSQSVRHTVPYHRRFPTTYTTRPGSVVAVWTCLSVSPFISHKPLLSVGQVTVGCLMFDSLLSTGDIQTKTLGKIAVLLCSLFVLCTNIFHPLKCYLIGQDLWVPDLLLWLVHHLLLVYIIRKWIIGNIDGCLKVRF